VKARAGLLAGSTLLGIALLGGCTTLGGNVKGSFSCQAPDGLCAPSSSIDDRALAMISGDAGDTIIPAGPYVEPEKGQGARIARVRTVAGAPAALAGSAPRTTEKVLRIVFQPYVDDYGRLHEASAVHAVVQSGEWREQAQRDASRIPSDREIAMPDPPATLSDALERAEANLDVAALDPNLPDAAVVAAARARRDDPIGAIKADVAARLRPPAPRTPLPAARVVTAPAAKASLGTSAPAAAKPASATAAPATSTATTANAVPATKPAASTPGAGQPVPAKPATATTIGAAAKVSSAAEAVARVKASDAYQAGAARAAGEARTAATSADAPALAPALRATVRAGTFPAAVTEDR
jgi:conjugal transfer pilus assembly protein TraV